MNSRLKTTLTQVRAAGVRKKSRGNRKPLPVAPYPLAAELTYKKRLVDYVKAMKKEVLSTLSEQMPPLLAQAQREQRLDDANDDLNKALKSLELKLNPDTLLDINPETLAYTVGNRVADQAKKSWKKITKAGLGFDLVGNEAWLVPKLKAFSAANASLITSLTDKPLDEVSTLAHQAVANGWRWEDLRDEVVKKYGAAESRARLIARDQVSKLNGQLSMMRQQAIGVEKYIWRTSQDDRVREDHAVMEGLLCRWDDATVYSEDGGQTWKSRADIGGVQLHPGEDYQCRCTAEAYLDDILDELGQGPSSGEQAQTEVSPPPVSVPIPEQVAVKKYWDTDTEHGKWEEASYSSSSDDVKELVRASGTAHEISYAQGMVNGEMYKAKGAFYSNDSVNMYGSDDMKGARQQSTFRHESGHRVDNQLGTATGSVPNYVAFTKKGYKAGSGYNGYYSSSLKFIESASKDRKDVLDTVGLGLSKKKAEAVDAKITAFMADVKDKNTVNDMYNRLLKGASKTLGISEDEIETWMNNLFSKELKPDAATVIKPGKFSAPLSYLKMAGLDPVMYSKNHLLFGLQENHPGYVYRSIEALDSIAGKGFSSQKAKAAAAHISDAIGSLTNNKFMGHNVDEFGGCGHTTKYLNGKNSGASMTEVFANMWDLKTGNTDPVILAHTKNVLPSLHSEMDDVAKMIIDYDKKNGPLPNVMKHGKKAT